MPRGGEGLIRAVAECSKVPVIKHYKGVCHVYVDGEADLAMAEAIALNAKVQRPAVCNAMETLLVDKAVAAQFLPAITRGLTEKKVELRLDPGDEAARADAPDPGLEPNLKPATEKDFFTEYNDYILNVRVVDGVKAGHRAHQPLRLGAFRQHRHRATRAGRGSSWTKWTRRRCIGTPRTRFTDGGEFGMGAEIGISTDKIGARGPMGLEELTSYKWMGLGNGQLRT